MIIKSRLQNCDRNKHSSIKLQESNKDSTESIRKRVTLRSFFLSDSLHNAIIPGAVTEFILSAYRQNVAQQRIRRQLTLESIVRFGSKPRMPQAVGSSRPGQWI
jgi:hypothetical protein